MNIEEKAKAYDEALGWMREMYPCLTDSLREDAEHYFPELAESEDERIRKFLIQHISEWIGCIEHDLKYSSKDIESEKELAMFKAGLAYLEKQKESLHIPETCKETANSFTDDIIEVRSFQRGMEEGRRLERQKEPENKSASTMAPSCWGVKQKEQKPNYCLYGGYPNVGRCRWCSAACSARLADVHTDEEKEYIRTIKSIISDFIRDKKPENLAYYQRIYDWLDGRHVPFSCGHENDKPAEWSAEDEEMLDYVISDVNDAKQLFTTKEAIDLCDEEIAWLKSLPEKFNLQSKQECGKVTINGEPVSAENYSVDIPLAEWSEDDEKDMAHIIRILDDCYAYGKHDLSKTDHENLVGTLKSLRPSWKPSEEQMAMLLAVINEPNNAGAESCHLALKSLHEHLKKLM